MNGVLQDSIGTAHDLETVVRRLYDEVWNAGRYPVAQELFHPDFRYDAAPDLRGAEAKLVAIRRYHQTFPDLHFAVEDLIVGVDVAGATRVAVRTTVTGTDTGGWRGARPTGRTVRAWGVEHFGFREDRIISNWVGLDWLGFLIQIGVIENPWTP